MWIACYSRLLASHDPTQLYKSTKKRIVGSQPGRVYKPVVLLACSTTFGLSAHVPPQKAMASQTRAGLHKTRDRAQHIHTGLVQLLLCSTGFDRYLFASNHLSQYVLVRSGRAEGLFRDLLFEIALKASLSCDTVCVNP